MTLFTQEDYKTRITAIQKLLTEKELDIAVFNHPAELYYYTGSVIPLYCIMPKEGVPILLARKGSSRIKDESPNMPLEIFSGSKDFISIIKKHFSSRILKAGFALESSSYSSVVRMLSLLGNPETVDISWDIRMLCSVKSDTEIAIQRKAGEIISAIPEIIRKVYKPGITELEMSAHIEFYLRTHGAGSLRCRQEGIVLAPGVFSAGTNSLSSNKFDGICAGTGLSPALPFGASVMKIPSNTSIICDYGFVFEGYHVDMTRMFSVGSPPAEALKAHEAMLSVEKDVIDALKAGASWESLWMKAEESAGNLGYTELFMGIGSEKVKFVGHGVGLYLDEPPYLAPKMPDIIRENMVIAIEPKVSLPGIGVVGIEDTFVVTASGAICITDCPKDFYIL